MSRAKLFLNFVAIMLLVAMFAVADNHPHLDTDADRYGDAPGYNSPVCWENGEFQPTDGCLGY